MSQEEGHPIGWADRNSRAREKERAATGLVKQEDAQQMRKTMRPIPAGSLFTVTTGVYSSYEVTGVFRAAADIDPQALLDEWLEVHPEQKQQFSFIEDRFLAFVFRKGLMEPVDTYEWHLADYSSSSAMDVDFHSGKSP